jgi:hypothetical protein
MQGSVRWRIVDLGVATLNLIASSVLWGYSLQYGKPETDEHLWPPTLTLAWGWLSFYAITNGTARRSAAEEKKGFRRLWFVTSLLGLIVFTSLAVSGFDWSRESVLIQVYLLMSFSYFGLWSRTTRILLDRDIFSRLEE